MRRRRATLAALARAAALGPATRADEPSDRRQQELARTVELKRERQDAKRAARAARAARERAEAQARAKYWREEGPKLRAEARADALAAARLWQAQNGARIAGAIEHQAITCCANPINYYKI